ncbi:MAG TPA: hydroxyacid dehydrogenase [Thermoguttaceae bacterium]|nr:hydroxyacid dehydrogenase [Thermoguttaceae bacterium]
MTDIVVSENVVGAPMDSLQREFDVRFDPDLWKSPDKLAAAVARAKALVVRNQTQVTADLIRVAENLQIIARAGAGLNNVDVEAASAAGIVVAYTPDENSVSVAELTVGLMLALARRISAADRDTRSGGWARRGFTGSELMDKTLGLVGLGRIGTLTAARARAFGMTIIAHDDFIDPRSPAVRELEARLVPLDDLLAEADFVTCHVPLTETTRGMFDYARFAKMKPGAMFVNTSRGEVVDEEGLIRALQEEKIGGAALDVRGTEPPGPSPLSEMDGVILTPHIAAFTEEAQHRVVASVCRDVAAVLRGDPAVGYANFPSPRRPPSAIK